MVANNNHSNHKVPGDWELLKPWLKLMRRAREAGSGKGPAVIRLNAVIDEYGNPIVWIAPVVMPLEPKMQSEESLMQLLERLSG